MFDNPRDYTHRVTANLALSSIFNCPALNESTKVDRPNDFQSLNPISKISRISVSLVICSVTVPFLPMVLYDCNYFVISGWFEKELREHPDQVFVKKLFTELREGVEVGYDSMNTFIGETIKQFQR